MLCTNTVTPSSIGEAPDDFFKKVIFSNDFRESQRITHATKRKPVHEIWKDEFSDIYVDDNPYLKNAIDTERRLLCMVRGEKYGRLLFSELSDDVKFSSHFLTPKTLLSKW
jgi:hypothetical protein